LFRQLAVINLVNIIKPNNLTNKKASMYEVKDDAKKIAPELFKNKISERTPSFNISKSKILPFKMSKSKKSTIIDVPDVLGSGLSVINNNTNTE
jgi:hypothetical protein